MACTKIIIDLIISKRIGRLGYFRRTSEQLLVKWSPAEDCINGPSGTGACSNIAHYSGVTWVSWCLKSLASRLGYSTLNEISTLCITAPVTYAPLHKRLLMPCHEVLMNNGNPAKICLHLKSGKHIVVETKWPPCCGQHFQLHLLNEM